MTTNMHPVSSPSIYGYCNIITTIYLSISFCWMHYVYQRYILYDYYFFFFDCNFFRCSFIFFYGLLYVVSFYLVVAVDIVVGYLWRREREQTRRHEQRESTSRAARRLLSNSLQRTNCNLLAAYAITVTCFSLFLSCATLFIGKLDRQIE